MNWFFYSIISIFALATAELTQQYLLNDEDNAINERTSTVVTILIQVLFVLPLIYLFGKISDFLIVFTDLLTVFYLVMGAILASIATIFYFRSFRVKNISISTIFVAFSTVVSTLLGIVMFGESTTTYKFVGIGLVLLAIISLNIKNLSLEKNHLFGLLAGIFYGSVYTIDKLIVLNIHPFIYIFWSFLFTVIVSFLMAPKLVIKEIKKSKLINYKPIALSAIGYLLYNFFTFTAYRAGGEVGRVDAINNSQIFLIILFEYMILKQKGNVVRKIVTALIAFGGVMILGFL